MIGFNQGDIVKLKTVWGGGFVLNFGETAGSTTPGLQARVHWNTSWDHPNRFQVVGTAQSESGFHWYMLVNRHSGLCLTARIVANFAIVTQEHCSPVNANQRWAGECGLSSSSSHGQAMPMAISTRPNRISQRPMPALKLKSCLYLY